MKVAHTRLHIHNRAQKLWLCTEILGIMRGYQNIYFVMFGQSYDLLFFSLPLFGTYLTKNVILTWLWHLSIFLFYPVNYVCTRNENGTKLPGCHRSSWKHISELLLVQLSCVRLLKECKTSLFLEPTYFLSLNLHYKHLVLIETVFVYMAFCFSLHSILHEWLLFIQSIKFSLPSFQWI